MSKTCKDCGLDKPLSEFYTYKRSDRITYYARCKSCQKIRLSEKVGADVKKNWQRERMANHRAIVNELKNVPCVDCLNSYPPYVMDFDHIEEGTKVMNIAQMISRDFGLKLIMTEIEKCEVVCSNCHRIRTYRRKSNVN